MTSPDQGIPPVVTSLREVVASDLPVFFDDQREPLAHQMADFPARDHDAFMTHWTNVMADPSVICRTVLVEGAVAGNVLSFVHEGRREVGYWIGRAFWGRGIASEALMAFVNIDRSRPLYAGVVAHNAASIRVLEKCGFVRSDQVDGYVDLVLEG